jgi:hypothetical protein
LFSNRTPDADGKKLLSDLEARFVCQACGTHRADIRPEFNSGRKLPQRAPRWLSEAGNELSMNLSRCHAVGRSSRFKVPGDYITKLPKAVHEAAERQAAMEALILVVTLGGPTMFARIGIMRGLNRGHVREYIA